jgi:probable rRNA maturation factor
MINIVCPSRYKLHKKELKKFVLAMLVEKNISTRQTLNIVFVGTRKMRDISSTYKHEDVALPVLAFPYNEIDMSGEQMLGEIILCYPQVVLLAAERGRKVDDMIQKLTAHGLNNIIRDMSTPEIE